MIRPAAPADVPEIVAMVHELATYERSADECHLTVDGLTAALFGPSPALFGHLATDDATGRPVGFALWYVSFSTWSGAHGVYLEDLYVRPEARRGGYGGALLRELAAVAVARGYPRLECVVLDWNDVAIDFYRKAGAFPMEGWTTWRLTGGALRAVAGEAGTAPGTG